MGGGGVPVLRRSCWCSCFFFLFRGLVSGNLSILNRYLMALAKSEEVAGGLDGVVARFVMLSTGAPCFLPMLAWKEREFNRPKRAQENNDNERDATFFFRCVAWLRLLLFTAVVVEQGVSYAKVSTKRVVFLVRLRAKVGTTFSCFSCFLKCCRVLLAGTRVYRRWDASF